VSFSAAAPSTHETRTPQSGQGESNGPNDAMTRNDTWSKSGQGELSKSKSPCLILRCLGRGISGVGSWVVAETCPTTDGGGGHDEIWGAGAFGEKDGRGGGRVSTSGGCAGGKPGRWLDLGAGPRRCPVCPEFRSYAQVTQKLTGRVLCRTGDDHRSTRA